MMKKYIGLVCGAVLFALLAAGCSGAFGFDGKEIGDKDNPFYGKTWEDSTNGYMLSFGTNTCEITKSTSKAAITTRAVTAGQISNGFYSYTWVVGDDGSFTATLKVYDSGIEYATFTITASGASGTLTVDGVPYSFKKTGSNGSTETDNSGKSDGEDDTESIEGFEIKDSVLVKYTGNQQNVIIPDSVYKIGDNAFSYYEELESVVIPNSVKYIGNSAFWGCVNLADVTIPNTVTTIDQYAFKDCRKLRSVTIPGSVMHIERYVFNGSGLKSVTLQSGVWEIRGNAFSNCASLESVTIPDSISGIDKDAFTGCPRNMTIYYGGKEERWKNVNLNVGCGLEGKKVIGKDGEWVAEEKSYLR